MNYRETKLRKMLREKNMSQKQLYFRIKERCGTPIGLDSISQIVSGKKQNYNIFTLMKICHALNCSPNDIIEKDLFVFNCLK